MAAGLAFYTMCQGAVPHCDSEEYQEGDKSQCLKVRDIQLQGMCVKPKAFSSPT